MQKNIERMPEALWRLVLHATVFSEWHPPNAQHRLGFLTFVLHRSFKTPSTRAHITSNHPPGVNPKNTKIHFVVY
jgi:hypothetical protein